MELVVVGSSGSASGPDNPASCYLVRTEAGQVVLDLGPGAFGALYGVTDPATPDAVVLSHLHADHCLDLIALKVAARHGLKDHWRQLPLVTPQHALVRLAQAELTEPATPEALAEGVDTYAEVFRHLQITDTGSVGPFGMRVARVAHPVEAYAIRLEAEGRSLVYSGDTGPCDALVELATGADVLLAEAGFADRDDVPPGVHLTGRQAGEAATAAGVGTLVLTHLAPWADVEATVAAASEAYAGPIEVARPGMRLTI
ncbi:MBL fold metallo-hydrolase [Enemella sp. A6]|uniref:MBL fold metallo-hydrolase n=1 Tax=Enemella sp. A6 TaxID=3440152 RepID=UPI003EB97F2C